MVFGHREKHLLLPGSCRLRIVRHVHTFGPPLRWLFGSVIAHPLQAKSSRSCQEFLDLESLALSVLEGNRFRSPPSSTACSTSSHVNIHAQTNPEHILQNAISCVRMVFTLPIRRHVVTIAERRHAPVWWLSGRSGQFTASGYVDIYLYAGLHGPPARNVSFMS